MTQGNKWGIVIKCRPITPDHRRGRSHQKGGWRSVKEVYPDAKVEEKHNDIEVTLPSLQEDIEIAAFGRPGRDDQKRMQMAIFGRHPTQGRDWKIWVYIVDDTTPACKVPHLSERLPHSRSEIDAYYMTFHGRLDNPCFKNSSLKRLIRLGYIANSFDKN